MDGGEGIAASSEEFRISIADINASRSGESAGSGIAEEDMSGLPSEQNADEEWIREVEDKIKSALIDSTPWPLHVEDETEPKICKLPLRDRISEPSCLVKMKNQVAKARSRYDLDEPETFGFEDERSFAEMLLLDSYFILFTLTIKLPRFYCRVSYIPNATELRESATLFEKKTNGSSLDIAFRRCWFERIIGVFHIPLLHILDYSSLIFYNLIVFEMQSSTRGRCTMAFSALMRSLLQSEEDVKLLRQRGILVSSSMTDRQLIDLFARLSRLTENHQMPRDLSNICRQVLSHHNHLVSRLCGGIILQYFSKPVVTLSVLVAALLFVPTLLQTIYAMIYHS
uniref:Uncharacterized protein n=1 Tax=Ananas comosus var. bracteatus TaxID=296719 RepID=A0A6V7P0N7_ANACO|nr:unnamed protein product [Ananas comosus var. bracteatus]